jgi:phosphoribosylglycinamide formyltransferase-1
MTSQTPFRLGFMASHGGTSMRAILSGIQRQELKMSAGVLISNNFDAAALATAAHFNVPTRVLNSKVCGSGALLDHSIAAALTEHAVDLVVLSGYRRKLGEVTLRTYGNRILNVHPSLLPDFGGVGMYGDRVFEAVLKARVSTTGVTIHLVDGEYDHGPSLAQCEISVFPEDTVETLAKRVQAMEPLVYIQTLQAIAEGRIDLDSLKHPTHPILAIPAHDHRREPMP